MNTHPGLIAKKLGNTQIFDEDGMVTRVTVLEVGPCTVLDKRTEERDGYSALVVGFGEKREKLVNKPEGGFYSKFYKNHEGTKPVRHVREFRLPAEEVAKHEIGAILKPSEVFEAGQFVDVASKSKGRGFTGVMKRWNFKGAATMTHGSHEYMRHGGSIGTNMTPGRTLPNTKMPGQSGNARTTVLNQKVVRVMDDEWIVLVAGAVPGAPGAIVTLRHAVKKAVKKAAS